MQSGLITVTIPSSVTIIGDGAFPARPNLTSIYFKGNAPAIDPGNAFWTDHPRRSITCLGPRAGARR